MLGVLPLRATEKDPSKGLFLCSTIDFTGVLRFLASKGVAHYGL